MLTSDGVDVGECKGVLMISTCGGDGVSPRATGIVERRAVGKRYIAKDIGKQ